MVVGEQLVKAGEYRDNPFARFGGDGTTWTHIDSNQCLAAAGRIAAGIQRVYVSDEVAVSLPTVYVADGHNTAPYTTEFLTDGPVMIKSTLQFHNVQRSAKWK